MSAPARAAARLLEEKGAIAHLVTDAMYEERPELLARFGEPGRAKCLQDVHYTIEHLVPAVELGRPAIFVDYARWLDELLRARHVSTRDVVRSFELVQRAVERRFPPDEAEAVASTVRSGLEALVGAPSA